MPTTFANTIDENEILAKRSQCDYAGNDIQTTYATKSELPTATSDLTNDSDFITSSDVPVKDVQVAGASVVNAQGIAEISIPQTGVLDVEVNGSSVVNAQGVAEIAIPTFTQVNADWDASSGVQEILNKPDLSIYAESSDLATVATSGSYNDLIDKPSIPSAQVNADWDATSGVSEILNKPNLATVATTGDYSDLQNLPSIPAAQVNSDWDATSGVAQILNKPTIPSYTAGNGIGITNNVISAKVDGATINTNASGELTVIGGGGGTQVNSDWDATSGVAEILNKPTLATVATTGDYDDLQNKPSIPAAVTVDQVYNASSTNAQSGAAVAGALATIDEVPAVTSSDDGKVLKATYSGGSGSYAWAAEPTVDQTYNASSTNAQSGTAVAGALATVNQVPASTSSDSTKVLTVNSSGIPVWAAAQGGGSSDVFDVVFNTTTTGELYDAITNGKLVRVYDSIYNKYYYLQSFSYGEAYFASLAPFSASGTTTEIDIKKIYAYQGDSTIITGWDDSYSGYTHSSTDTYDATSPDVASCIAVADALSTVTLSTLNTAGITDIQQVAALPANPVSTVLYLIPET